MRSFVSILTQVATYVQFLLDPTDFVGALLAAPSDRSEIAQLAEKMNAKGAASSAPTGQNGRWQVGLIGIMVTAQVAGASD